MKIVHVVPNFNIGGIEKFVRELAIEQSRLGNIVYIISLSKSENNKNESEILKVLNENEIKVFLLKKERQNRIIFLKSLRNLIKNIKPDVINTHNEEVTFHTICATLLLRYKIFEVTHSRKCNYPKLQKYYIKYFVKKIIAISTETKKNFINSAGINNKKIKLIFNGIDLKEFKLDNRKINRKVETIISIGRLSEEKNHEILIRSFSKLKDDLNKLNIYIPKLYIIGDGNQKDILKSIIKNMDLEENVFLLGEKKYIVNLLKKADIYVLPSKTEGLSISLIEALATGIPVIASNVGGNSDLVHDRKNGLLFESNNEEDLKNKILEYIKNYDLRKEVSEASLISVEDFDIKICCDNYLKTYLE
ncbi:glycosyltransferase family 4 protein [Clostridium perfringens]|nr:glycosyltransferase family 4 protein [Clostridium perfringens]